MTSEDANPPALRATIDAFLRRVAAVVRRRRAARWALRGAFWGASSAVAVLAAKGAFGELAIPLALALFCIGTVTGAVLAAIRGVTPIESARLADCAFGLHDRIATTLECAAAAQRSPFFGSLLNDTAARVQTLEARTVVGRTSARDARLAAIPVLIAMVLAIAPPLPGLTPWSPDGWRAGPHAAPEQDRNAVQAAGSGEQEPVPQRDPLEMADTALNAAGGPQSTAGERPGSFKDKTLAERESDFSNFIKKGDDRLKVLEHIERLPDLKADGTGSQYKSLMRSAGNLANPRAGNISPEKLGNLLRELAELGRKGNEDFRDDARNGLQALDEGRPDEALQAMQNALEKMREAEDRRRDAKGLPSSVAEAGTPDTSGKGVDQGSSSTAQGNPAPRLRSTPYNVGLQGQRSGRAPTMETRFTGRAGAMEAQRQYLGVIGEYRKMMEDAITREQVPRDYQGQVRNYFKALGER